VEVIIVNTNCMILRANISRYTLISLLQTTSSFPARSQHRCQKFSAFRS
jgi:hypothetical protein